MITDYIVLNSVFGDLIFKFSKLETNSLSSFNLCAEFLSQCLSYASNSIGTFFCPAFGMQLPASFSGRVCNEKKFMTISQLFLDFWETCPKLTNRGPLLP